jgi:putative peptide zinc metalloprotease protein
MSDGTFSSSWYRVAGLKPRIRSHARFSRHHYRGEPWYVLQDPISGRSHRLSPSAYQIIGLMNGERTIQQIWQLVDDRLGDDAPTQDETIRILGQLHFADAIRCDVPPDTVEMFRRRQRRSEGEWWRRLTNPLSVKIPLFDPDAFLVRWLPLARPLFSWPALVAWCLVVGGAALVAASRWTELTQGAATELLDPRSLLVIWIAYPIVKAIHELGHGFATRIWGGEVHEIGIMFLVLMPVPYIDASSASTFPEKWRRAVVGAAGILVELGIAALAVLVWAHTEPGLVRSVAYHVLWIGGTSALLFNGNPLLRFDGYYILSDLIEIPNLAARSRQHLAGLILRKGFGLENVRDPVTARGEAAWFVGYGVASFAYRLVVLFGIALFVAGKFIVVGVLLALFTVAMQIVVPLLRQISFLLTSPRLGANRVRAVGVSAAVALAVAILVLLVPVPSRTRAEGIVWPPEGAEVRAHADGFVLRVLAQPGSIVEPGEPLVLTRDPSLEARVAVLEAQLWELRARNHAEWSRDRVRAQITQEEIETTSAELAYARQRVGEVVVRSATRGTFVVLQPGDLLGRFVEQGDLIGYVLGEAIDTVRVVVSQADAALVRDRTKRVEVRLSRQIGRVLPAVILRAVPGATHRLPNPALGTRGGGRFGVDPSDPEGLQTLEPVFQLELALADAASIGEIGGRAYVRLDHGAEPAAAQAYRALRRLFLRRFGA